MEKSGVYQIVNTITGECYIGSSIDLESRRKQHLRESTWKKEPNKQLYKDMKQYGKNNFLFKPIQLCDPEELKKYEQIVIEKYNPKYNLYAAYTGMSKEEYNKQYYKENADSIKQYQKQYYNQKCLYENELLSLDALAHRFAKKGIKHSTLEAKKYLIGE